MCTNVHISALFAQICAPCLNLGSRALGPVHSCRKQMCVRSTHICCFAADVCASSSPRLCGPRLLLEADVGALAPTSATYRSQMQEGIGTYSAVSQGKHAVMCALRT